MKKPNPDYVNAVAGACGNLVGAALVYLHATDPTNPYANEEYTLREFRKATEAVLGKLDSSAMTMEDIRKDIVLTCDFVKKILTS